MVPRKCLLLHPTFILMKLIINVNYMMHVQTRGHVYNKGAHGQRYFDEFGRKHMIYFRICDHFHTEAHAMPSSAKKWFWDRDCCGLKCYCKRCGKEKAVESALAHEEGGFNWKTMVEVRHCAQCERARSKGQWLEVSWGAPLDARIIWPKNDGCEPRPQQSHSPLSALRRENRAALSLMKVIISRHVSQQNS